MVSASDIVTIQISRSTKKLIRSCMQPGETLDETIKRVCSDWISSERIEEEKEKDLIVD